MPSRILLVNFGQTEQKRISDLGLSVNIGLLEYAGDFAKSFDPQKRARPQSARFYSPHAIHEYHVTFIRLHEAAPLAAEHSTKANIIDEKLVKKFFRYWYNNQGIMVIFADEGAIVDLLLLGIPQVWLEDSAKNDETIITYKTEKEQDFRRAIQELKTSISMPPPKYIIIPERESEYNVGKRWTIHPIYANYNDDVIGAYLAWGYRHDRDARPAFLILPAYKDYGFAIEKILAAIALAFPKWLPEIVGSDWPENDKYYPKEVAEIENERIKILTDANSRAEALGQQKILEKNKYSYLIQLLTADGDELKDSVIKVLIEVFGLKVEDLDKTRTSDFREDIEINDETTGRILFAEIKGTQNMNPTTKYVIQLLNNLRKRGNVNLNGALILNHDRTREPKARPIAYATEDDIEAIKDITYLDTRVLYQIAMAIIDYGMPITDAKDIVFGKGRIVFDLNKYINRK